MTGGEYAKLILANTVVTSFLIFVFKDLIGGYLIKYTESSLAKSLAKLESDLRRSEYFVQAKIDENNRKISHLRETAVTRLFQSSAELEKRRLESAQILWEQVVALEKYKFPSRILSVLKMDKVIQRIERDDKLKLLFKTFNADIDVKRIDTSNADKHRVFISPLSWALFEAYRAVILQGVAISKLLELGINPSEALEMDKIRNLVLSVLPSYSEFIEKHELFALNAALEPLQKMVLDQVRADLQNTNDTKESTERAIAIIRAVDQVKASQQAI